MVALYRNVAVYAILLDSAARQKQLINHSFEFNSRENHKLFSPAAATFGEPLFSGRGGALLLDAYRSYNYHLTTVAAIR